MDLSIRTSWSVGSACFSDVPRQRGGQLGGQALSSRMPALRWASILLAARVRSPLAFLFGQLADVGLLLEPVGLGFDLQPGHLGFQGGRLAAGPPRAGPRPPPGRGASEQRPLDRLWCACRASHSMGLAEEKRTSPPKNGEIDDLCRAMPEPRLSGADASPERGSAAGGRRGPVGPAADRTDRKARRERPGRRRRVIAGAFLFRSTRPARRRGLKLGLWSPPSSRRRLGPGALRPSALAALPTSLSRRVFSRRLRPRGLPRTATAAARAGLDRLIDIVKGCADSVRRASRDAWRSARERGRRARPEASGRGGRRPCRESGRESRRPRR